MCILDEFIHSFAKALSLQMIKLASFNIRDGFSSSIQPRGFDVGNGCKRVCIRNKQLCTSNERICKGYERLCNGNERRETDEQGLLRKLDNKLAPATQICILDV